MDHETSKKPGWGELLGIRMISNAGGGVSDFQILQLKTWPLVAAPHAKSFEVEVRPEAKTVTYKFRILKKAKTPADFQLRLNALVRSTIDMLGASWSVTVMINKKVVPNAGSA